ncbi:hypothetical protein EDC01DRAFT_330530 [Geopyxis carbonaria]|nr:hypothetical protein EDC01DRAFT_330530 [Geopyxis carbonaria]
MVYNILSYRRPSRVDSISSSESRPSLASSLAHSRTDAKKIAGIPSALSFDKIISGGTCPPMTCRDFMKYLIYIEHCAENLQFFLWYKDYVERFEKLSENEKALSPEFVKLAKDQNAAPKTVQKFQSENSMHGLFSSAFKSGNTGGLSPPSPTRTHHSSGSDPFRTPPATPSSDMPSVVPFAVSIGESTLKNIDHHEIAAKAFDNVDVKWQPFTVQPFREEITRIIAIYLTEGSPRELNLSSRDRISVIKALAQTTHPSALKGVRSHIENTLRFQSHPNFIRWSICNGNTPRIWFARGLGVFTTLAGMIIAIAVTLSSLGRGWRALAAIAWVIGIATYFAAHKGMCVVLHGMHHYHVRPWELWNDDTDYEKSGPKESFETSSSKNSYEDEPWVEKYEKRFIIRKIFDREAWVQEPALRQIQDTIAVQAFCIAIISSSVLSAIFIAVPSGNLF